MNIIIPAINSAKGLTLDSPAYTFDEDEEEDEDFPVANDHLS